MKLEQLIYAGNKAWVENTPAARESTDVTAVHSTVSATKGLSDADCQKLESCSPYFLPPTLLFRQEANGPVKHVYYSLDDQRSVAGRAVYSGRDKLGRQGNYIFHNLVFPRERLLYLDFNPVTLIRWLEKQKLFLDNVAQDALKIIDIPDVPSVLPRNAVTLSRDDWAQIFHFCHNYRKLGKPFLIIGETHQCLDFLEILFFALPFETRAKITFDTYSYGMESESNIIGIPNETEFDRPVQWALKLNLETMQLSSHLDLERPTESADLIAQIISGGSLNEINSMYRFEYYLQKGDVARFKEGARRLPGGLREFIGESNRELIVNYLKIQNDSELLQMVINTLEAKDVEALTANREIIRELVETGNERVQGLYMLWFYKHKTRTEFYPLLFSSPVVMNLFLKWLDSCYYDLTFLVAIFRLLPAYYSTELELLLLNKILSVLRYLQTDEKLSPILQQTIRLLPDSSSASVRVLRLWLEYELSGKEELRKKLANADPRDIPEKYRLSFTQEFAISL